MNNHTEDNSDFAKKAEMLSHASVEEFQTPTWNNAIQSCIDVFEKELASWGVSFQANPNRKFFDQFYTDIISKLQSLKK